MKIAQVIAAGLALPVLCLACLPLKQYRHRDSLISSPGTGIEISIVEFDDQGDLWAPSQLQGAIEMIERAHRANNTSLRKDHPLPTVVVVFVHGWNNNASAHDERTEGRSLHEFRQFLEVLRGFKKMEDQQLRGVFLAWRGRSIKGMSFYARQATAGRIAGNAFSAAVLKILNVARPAPGTKPHDKCVLIGHSFGGLILERAMTAAMLDRIERTRPQAGVRVVDEMADLIVLLNPASNSLVAKQFIDALQGPDRVEFTSHPDTHEDCGTSRPVIVSLTSSTDNATSSLFRSGMAMSSTFKRFREYEARPHSQRYYFTHTAGHNPDLLSHELTIKRYQECPLACKVRMPFLRIEEDSTYAWRFDLGYSSGDHPTYAVTLRRRGGCNNLNFNSSSYWILAVPPEIVPNHSDVFTPEAMDLLIQLYQLSDTHPYYQDLPRYLRRSMCGAIPQPPPFPWLD